MSIKDEAGRVKVYRVVVMWACASGKVDLLGARK